MHIEEVGGGDNLRRVIQATVGAHQWVIRRQPIIDLNTMYTEIFLLYIVNHNVF